MKSAIARLMSTGSDSQTEEVEVLVEAAGVGGLEIPVEAGQEQAGEEDAKGEEKSPTPKAKKDKKSKKGEDEGTAAATAFPRVLLCG